MTNDYSEVTVYLESLYDEVDGFTFYRDLFPNCENEGELNEDYSKPNAVYLYEDDTGKKHRRIMLNDKWEEDYMNYVERNGGTLCGGLSYRGRTNRLEHAQQMNALIIDLDGVGLNEIRNLFLRFNMGKENPFRCPMPTYLVASGGGLHIYYVFEEPIDLFPNIKLQMKALKYALTFKVWDYTVTSKYEKIQYQSINQGFRMVGSENSKYHTVIRAYRIGDKVSLSYLNDFVQEKDRVDITQRFRPSKMSREQAKEKFPEWYQRVVIEGNKRQKKWDIAGQKGHKGDELYNWWLYRAGEVKGGHRYFFMMCLVIYACKCDIPKKRLKEDLQSVFSVLSDVEHNNPLEQKDIESALETYSREYYNFTIADIEKLSDLRIQRNKRNGRKQKDHIKVMNTMKALKKQLGEEVNEGRPKGSSKEKKIVTEWRKAHPEGRKADCIRDTGLNKKTVYRWWNTEPEPEIEFVQRMGRVNRYGYQ